MRKMLIIRILVVAICIAALSPAARADSWDILGEGLAGAAEGAIWGAIIGGGDGAAVGATLGGMTGMAAGSARDEERRRQHEYRQREYERREWQREREMYRRQLEQSRQQVQYEQPAVTATASAGGDRQLTIEIQKSLVRLGFDPGPINGILGPATLHAIKAYQLQHNLLDTGTPSDALLKHMVRNGG